MLDKSSIQIFETSLVHDFSDLIMASEYRTEKCWILE